MYITTQADAFKTRPIKPLYAKTQATAQDWILDDGIVGGSTTVLPGMVMTTATNADGTITATPCNASKYPIGLMATFYNNGVTDEITSATGNKISIWVADHDALFDTSTFDATANWTGAITTNLANGLPVFVGSNASGYLTILESDSYALTTDTTFVAGKIYYTKSGDVYTAATVTTGESVTATTYYERTTTFSTDKSLAVGRFVGLGSLGILVAGL